MSALSARAHARIAGVAFLLYIATGVGSLVIMSPANATGTAARLAALAEHAGRARISVLLGG